jgi:hypothetical protein
VWGRGDGWEIIMSKRDELIEKYVDQLRGKLGHEPDVALLTKVTIGCGPTIYRRDSSTVAASDPSEVATVKKNFLLKKLGLIDNQRTDEGLHKVLEVYGAKCRTKYRAVVYYLLTKEFGRESVYNT